ncbi:MAG TPA: hypothetical protein VHB98_03540, partial [Chloroflexota bacterium]|nr:hypothetical protein [Chloroflexota bacterium]
MKRRSRAARLVPAVMVAAATAIPAVTAVDLLTHAPASTSLVALNTSASGSSPPAGSQGSSATATPPAASGSSSGSKTYVGTAEQNQYGTVQATLVVTGNKITNVIITAPQDNPRSANINSYAVPILVSETL